MVVIDTLVKTNRKTAVHIASALKKIDICEFDQILLEIRFEGINASNVTLIITLHRRFCQDIESQREEILSIFKSKFISNYPYLQNEDIRLNSREV